MLFERCLHSPSLASVHRFKDDGDLQVTHTHTHMTGGFIARFKPTRFRPWSTATRGAAELLLMRTRIIRPLCASEFSGPTKVFAPR